MRLPLGVVLLRFLPEMPQPPNLVIPGIEAFMFLAGRTLRLRLKQRREHRYRNRLADLVLDVEDVPEFAVIGLGPDVSTRRRVDELGCDPDAVLRPRTLPSTT